MTFRARLLLAIFFAGMFSFWAGREIGSAQACVTGFSPPVMTIPPSGSPATVNVLTSSPSCQWAVSGNFPTWLNFPSPFAGVGPGPLFFNSVLPNPDPMPRSTTITVGGVGLDIIQQANPCPLTLSPPGPLMLPANGGQASFQVNTSGTGCSYSTSPGPGVSIVSGGTGNTFPATVTIAVGPNTTQEPRSLFVLVSSTGTFGPTTPGIGIVQSGPPIFTDVPPLGIGFAVHRGTGGPHTTQPEPILIANAVTPGAAWTATPTEPWLDISPASGVGPTLAAISIDAAQAAILTRGVYQGFVSITGSDAPQSPRQIFVQLYVTDSTSQTFPPIGVVDIPMNGSTGLSGAVPVGGWSVDDVGIRRVQIFRNSVGSEPPGEVFLGDATRVRGARPDIAGMSRSPEATRGGWGFMILSNVLPNLGNGTFTLSAYADDIEGHRTLLGRKTVSFDNTSSTLPFGTIDVPAQGGNASGVVNIQGWVLAQPGRTIPFDGSTIRLVIDGAIQPHAASYGNPRPDVAAFFPFPTYANANGPAAQFTYDTAVLANGLHTVAWIATDDQGATEGLGSRYFNVVNSMPALAIEPAPDVRSAREIQSLPLVHAFMWDRRGYDDFGWSLRLAGRASNEIRQAPAQRLEVAFDTWWWSRGCEPYRGYLLREEVALPLPAGSSLDGVDGVFRWLPPAGVSGTFDLAFVRRSCSGREEQIPLRVTIAPE